MAIQQKNCGTSWENERLDRASETQGFMLIKDSPESQSD